MCWAWGWNANRRAGNLTMEELREPRQVQHSNNHRFISVSSGTHHSAAVTDSGIILTFGDGSKGQLGYANIFTNVAYRPNKLSLKPGLVESLQAFPTAVTPTGSYKQLMSNKDKKGDLLFCSVTCGDGFTVAREISPVEASTVVKDFLPLEKSINKLKSIFNDSNCLQRVWSEVRQERWDIDKGAEGTLVVFGTGNNGQLGLGDHTLQSPYPQVLHRLRDTGYYYTVDVDLFTSII